MNSISYTFEHTLRVPILKPLEDGNQFTSFRDAATHALCLATVTRNNTLFSRSIVDTISIRRWAQFTVVVTDLLDMNPAINSYPLFYKALRDYEPFKEMKDESRQIVSLLGLECSELRGMDLTVYTGSPDSGPQETSVEHETQNEEAAAQPAKTYSAQRYRPAFGAPDQPQTSHPRQPGAPPYRQWLDQRQPSTRPSQQRVVRG